MNLTIYPQQLQDMTLEQLAALPVEQKIELEQNLCDALIWLIEARAKFDAAMALTDSPDIVRLPGNRVASHGAVPALPNLLKHQSMGDSLAIDSPAVNTFVVDTQD